MRTTIPELEQIATALADRETPLIEATCSVGSWQVKIFTRPIIHPLVSLLTPQTGATFGVISAAADNMFDAVNAAADLARTVIADTGTEVAA